jgi:hypothetical protein
MRISHLGACTEREECRATIVVVIVISRDNNTGMFPPIITRPVADEGSQTSLNGSLLAGLIINNNSTLVIPTTGSSGPPPLPLRPVKPAPSGGSTDSILPSKTQKTQSQKISTTFNIKRQIIVFLELNCKEGKKT